MARILLIVLAVALGIGGCERPLTSPDLAPAGWLQHRGEGFSLRYPPEADVSPEGPGLTRFRYIGPAAQPQTDITDGFIVTLGVRPLAADQEPAEFAQAELNRIATVGEPLTPVGRTMFQQRPAYQYRMRTIAETTHLIVPHGDDHVLQIGWSVIDPSDRGYEAMVQRMLETIELHEIAEEN